MGSCETSSENGTNCSKSLEKVSSLDRFMLHICLRLYMFVYRISVQVYVHKNSKPHSSTTITVASTIIISYWNYVLLVQQLRFALILQTVDQKAVHMNIKLLYRLNTKPKKGPWAEHLTSLPKRGVGALSSFDCFRI